MKQVNIWKAALSASLFVVLCISAVSAQCTDKQKNSPECQRTCAEMKAKFEANGMEFKMTEMKPMHAAETSQSNARQCVKGKDAHVQPNKVSKELLSRLPKERQDYVKSHPELYVITD